MPFFPNIKIKYLNKNVTLQVRNSPDMKTLSRKRVWFSASMTVEAALGLSLFVFAAVTLMMPMKLMDNQRKIQAALEAVCEDASRYAYIQYQLQQGQGESLNTNQVNVGQVNTDQANTDQEDTSQIWDTVDTAAVCLYASANIRKYLDLGVITNISFARTEVNKEDDIIHLVMDYKMIFPFPVFRITGLPMTSVSRRRAWTGRDGRLGGDGDGAQQEDRIVYVGKNSTRYHWLRTCHYLDNKLSSYPKQEIGNIRNEYGRKYSACSLCGKLAGENSTVYVMASGGSYHSNPYCSSIIAYVRAVPLSEVAYMGECSYCSRKGGVE